MSTSIDERGNAFKAAYGHEQEMKFKAESIRNRKLGMWAGGLLNLTGADLDAYVDAVFDASFEEPGDDDIIRKLMKDFNDKGLGITEHRIEQELVRCLAEAKAQLA